MKNFIVYKHTAPNGKVYIGITSQTPSKRWNNGRGYEKNIFFYNAIQKYGWENIKHEILFDSLTKEEAEQKEVELIEEYKSNQREYGYNVARGGLVNIPTEEQREKLRKIKSGIKASEETRRKMSLRQKGKIISAETRKKTAIALKGNKNALGCVRSEATRKLISETHSKGVLQYDKNGTLLGEFKSITIAGETTGVNFRNISEVCKGHRNTAGGFVWKYADIQDYLLGYKRR